MAPINNKSPFNNTKKQTGTVPKTTSTTSSSTSFNGNKASSSSSSTTKNTSSSRKNTEIVAPTRRELNDLNNYLLSVTSSSESTKQQNSSNCTGTGATGVTNTVGQQLDPTCFELDNLQENQRFCYPVRPIPRRNIINKKHQSQDNNNLITNFQSGNQQSNNIINSSAAAVGVVIPTTPGSNLIVSQQQQNIIQSASSTDHHQTNNPQQQQFFDLNTDLNWEERLNFIQYFLSLTSKSNNKAFIGNPNKMVNDIPVFVNSTSLEDVANSEASDNRAHSVSSIHTNLSINDQSTTTPTTTPNYDELQNRLEHSNRNIQNIKEQQQQLLRLQQAAKQHLTDMEDVRNRMPIRYDSSNATIPDYESVEAVHNDMSNLVNRMKNLQVFIQNQNQLSALLGDDSPDILAEQELLQRKLNELKTHRNEMKSLVNELQDINEIAEQRSIQQNNHDEENNDDNDETQITATAGTSNRIVPIDYQRIVPVELVGSSKKPSSSITNGQQHNGGLVNGRRSHEKSREQEINHDHNNHNYDNENNVDDQMDTETANIIQQKVADINAMKIQLQRLKDMMATVKLIEDKAEDKIPEAQANNDNSSEQEIVGEEILTTTSSTRRPIEIPITMQREFSKNFDKIPENPPTDNFNNNTPKNVATLAEEEAMSERVRLLHEMTADLREQAVSLTSERDRLKSIKEDMKRRNINNSNNQQLDKNSNIGNNNENITTTRNNINTIQPPIKVDSEKDLLKAEYEAKKKEFEKICQRLQSEEDNNNQEQNIDNNDDDTEYPDDDLKQDGSSVNNYYTENWQEQQNQSNSNNNIIGGRPVTLTSCNSSVHEKQSGTITGNLQQQNRGKDSADSGAADVHGITSLEAGSIQSGSSRSYSMPPPMRTIIMSGNGPNGSGSGGNNRDTPWRKNSQDHSNSVGGGGGGVGTSSQHQYMDHNYVSLPTMPPSSWNAYYYNPYSPHFSYHQPQPPPAPTNGTNGNEFICPHSSYYNNNGLANNLTNNIVGPNNVNDPVLLQQFIQTQQMLINSVCQCNQLLWHQQREINNLNNTVVSLQERLLNSPADLGQVSNRGESVPLQNNMFGSISSTNRAHSEQPSQRPPPLHIQQQHYQSNQTPMSPNRYQYHNGYNYGNFYQHHFYQQHHQQQRRHNSQHQLSGGISSNSYNYLINPSADQQLQQNDSSQQIPTYQPRHSSPIPTTITNSVAAGANNIPQQQNFLNNADTMNMQSPPPSTGVAPPIFMHHHNNNIGSIGHHTTHLNNNLNNNSNLLNSQQNCLNSNQTAANQNSNNATVSNAAAASALNNQVPPGNRANNYWDNFRSYSRQNLLSSNSCKSNEEHNHHQQQQQQLQQLHQQHQHITQPPPPAQFNSSNSTNIYRNHQLQQNYNSNISTAVQTQQPQINNTSNNNVTVVNTSNNLNPQNYDSKYFHTFRNEFNTIGDHQQQQQSTANQSAVNINNNTNCITASNSENVPGSNRDQSNIAMILSNIQNQHLEVNQGGSASSNLSNNQSDNLNLNENIFDFNNTPSNLSINNNNTDTNDRIADGIVIVGMNNNTNNNNNIAAIFGSPDFRNMNFNFGVNEQKKIPIKGSCNNTKQLRHTQSAPANNIPNENLYFHENGCTTGSSPNNGNRITDGIENLNQNNILNLNQQLHQQHGNINTNSIDNGVNTYEDIIEGAVGIDETSEEIKRNLLVNALKSDKFTSKFFETLKEDVYRQAYAIIQEKKCDQQFLAQLFEELKGAAAYDPLRNLLIQSNNNIKPTTTASNRSFNDTESNDGDNEMENYDQDDNTHHNLFNNLPSSSRAQTTLLHSGYENIDNSIWSTTSRDCSSLSNNEHRNTTINDSIMESENIRDTDIMTSLLNSKDMKMLAYKFMMSGGNITIDQQHYHKNKLQEKNGGEINQNGSDNDLQQHDGARGLPLSSSSSATSFSYRPDVYIVNYVMRRIRKELHTNCIIDDPIMIRIAKTTVTMLQDAILILGGQKKSIKINHLEITPKEMYTKMKTFNKRDNEHFLVDYQNYLIHIINENGNINLTKPSSSSRQYPQQSSSNDNSLITTITNRTNNRPTNEQQTGFVNRCSTTNNNNNNSNFPLWTDNIQQNIFRNCNDASNDFKSNISTCNGEIKVENIINNNQQHNRPTMSLSNNTNATAHHDIGSPCTNNSNNIMNEDLAEADQICSSANINSTNNSLIGNSERNTFTLSVVGNNSNHNEVKLNGSAEIPQRNHSLEVDEFFEHDILGDNASMNEEDQDDAEEAAAAAAAAEGINNIPNSTTLNIESFTGGRTNLGRIYPNSIINLETENNEDSLDEQHQKPQQQQHFQQQSHSSNLMSNKSDCCIATNSSSISGAYALVYPINNNLLESTENLTSTIQQNNNFDIVTRVIQQQPQSDSNCSSPSNFSTSTKKSTTSLSKSNKRNSVP